MKLSLAQGSVLMLLRDHDRILARLLDHDLRIKVGKTHVSKDGCAPDV